MRRLSLLETKCQNWCPLIFLCITLARTWTGPGQRLPNIQCRTWLCVTLHIGDFENFKKCPEILTSLIYAVILALCWSLRALEWKVKISDWNMNNIGPESNTINHSVYDLISYRVERFAKTQNEIKRSVYISLFLFAFSVGRFQIWYSLFPSILSQQICFSLSYNFCIWCIHFVFSLKENPFRAKIDLNVKLKFKDDFKMTDIF